MSPPLELSVALVQMRPEPLDPDANFATAATHIRNAASQSASLAVLPEYHLTGWLPEDARFREIAARSHTYLTMYQQLAKECSINIVPGTIVAMARSCRHVDGDSLLNKPYFINSDGEILGEYTKCNLWYPERTHLTSAPDFLRANMEHDSTSEEHHSVIELSFAMLAGRKTRTSWA